MSAEQDPVVVAAPAVVKVPVVVTATTTEKKPVTNSAGYLPAAAKPPPSPPASWARRIRLFARVLGLTFFGCIAFAILSGNSSLSLLKNNLFNIWTPGAGHSSNVPGPFIEQWTFKTVLPDATGSVTFIPGIFEPSKREKFVQGVTDPRQTPHAFVMVVRSEPVVELLYYRYAPWDFAVTPTNSEDETIGFSVRIGNSTFGTDGLHLDLDSRHLSYTSEGDYARFVRKALDDRHAVHPHLEKLHKHIADLGLPVLLEKELERKPLSIKGDIAFTDMTGFKSSPLIPNLMGPLAYVPLMQTYHNLVSHNHDASGTVQFLNVDGSKERSYVLHGGVGSIDQMHGTAAADNWIHLQTNSFIKEKGSSLSVTVVDVPFLNPRGRIANFIWYFPFIGERLVSDLHVTTYLVTLHHASTSKTHNLGTYTLASLAALSIDSPIGSSEEHVSLRFKNFSGETELIVDARRGLGGGVPVAGARMERDRMGLVAERSFDAEIDVVLTVDGKVVFEDTGRAGTMEVAGDMARLTNGVWRLE
ncbi:hypothetical protein HKX48_004693 [Thoreauomyces humboldtii]|nr:hypothetical protein HKX48_004693 [Thoreauomyces humboldtii]